MAFVRRKNGVPVLNKLKASGVPITSLGQKFVNLDLEFMQFEISTTQGGSTDFWSNWLGTPGPGADVSWGDGTFETVNAGGGLGNDVLHSYASNGNYSVRYYSVNSGLQVAFKDATGKTLVREFITDVTSWGWVLSFPKFYERFWSDYVSVVSATDVPGNCQILGARGTALTYVGISAFPDDVWWAGPFGPSTLYNEDISAVRPCSLGTSAAAKFLSAVAFNRNLGRWAENNLTRAITNYTQCFESTYVYNDGNPVGTSGGGVGIGIDNWNVNCTYAKGTNTSVTTNKLIDSSATFVTDGVVAGMQVYIIYDRTFTTIASVDSETELTLNADLFTSTPLNYLIRNSSGSVNSIVRMFYNNRAFNSYIGSWDITGLKSLQIFMYQYQSGTNGFNQDISSWDIVHVTNMQQAFYLSQFNFGVTPNVANTIAQAWDDRTWQVQNWLAFTPSTFNSDTTGWQFGLPNNMPSGTNTTQSTNKLIDSGATFQTNGVTTAWRVTNMDTGKQANVSAVNSETELTLASDIFLDAGAGENYEVFYQVNMAGCGLAAVDYDTSVWDTRCSTNLTCISANVASSRTQWDWGKWNFRNVNTLASILSSSGYSLVINFQPREWERGVIGDADYSTTKCATSLQNAFYQSKPSANKGCENWDTRNVTSMATINQNGSFKQSVGEWDIRSLTNVTNAFYTFAPTRIQAQIWLQWPFQTPGPLNGVNAASIMLNALYEKGKTDITVSTGTTTGVGTTYSDKVIDSSALFVTNGVLVGDTVNNLTTGKHAYVMSVDSETQLTVTQEYFSSIGDSYNVQTDYDGQHAYQGFLKLVAPTPSSNRTTGTTTSTTDFKLVDSGASFLSTVSAGDVVKNVTDTTYSYVVSVDSDTQLTIWDNIFVSGESYSVDGGFGWTITNIYWRQVAGTNTSVATNKLIDANASFTTTVAAGMIAQNTSPVSYATILSVDSDTQLTLDADIFTASPRSYRIDYQF